MSPAHLAYAVVETELWQAGAGARAGHQPFDVTVLYEDLLEHVADGLDRKSSLLHRHPDEVLIAAALFAAARAGWSARPAHQTPSEGGPLMEPPTRDTTATGRPSAKAETAKMDRQPIDRGPAPATAEDTDAGTGFMGAFTTYSTLALETNTLLGAGRSTDALVYAATLIGGPLERDRHRRSRDRRRSGGPRPGKPPMRPASHRTTPTNQARERQ